jgi:hypothetical protein
MSLNFNCNFSSQYSNVYRQNLEQFYSDCNELKKTPINHVILEQDRLNRMKTFHTPLLEAGVAAYFDETVKMQWKRCDESKFSQNSGVTDSKLSGSEITSRSISLIKDLKPQIIKEIEKGCKTIFDSWDDCGLDQWLSAELAHMPMHKQSGMEKDAIELVNKFWRDCAKKWLNKNNFRVFIPSRDLEVRMSQFSKNYGLEQPNCEIFTLCYFNIEDAYRAKRFEYTTCLEFLRKELKYYLVSQAKTNDMIIYLDSNNKSVHFGFFIDENNVCSKFGKMPIYIHPVASSIHGSAYIILRKA